MSYLPVSQPLGHHLQHFKFSWTQALPVFPLGNTISDGFRKMQFIFHDLAYRGENLNTRGIFQQVSMRAVLGCTVDFLVVIEAGEDDYLWRTGAGKNPGQHIQSALFRHTDRKSVV